MLFGAFSDNRPKALAGQQYGLKAHDASHVVAVAGLVKMDGWMDG